MKMKQKAEKATLASISKSIEGLATKAELKRLATKADFERSIEKLAVITARGFENTVSKTEFTEFKNEMTDFAKKTGVTLFSLDSHARTTNERLDAIEKILGPLVQVSSVMQKEIRDLNLRVTKLEHREGIKH